MRIANMRSDFARASRKKISDGLSFAFLLLQGALWAIIFSFKEEPG